MNSLLESCRLGSPPFPASLFNRANVESYECSKVFEEQELDEVELLVEVPAVEILGDLYVCAACGQRLTEIPEYNRYYCENCGLHY